MYRAPTKSVIKILFCCPHSALPLPHPSLSWPPSHSHLSFLSSPHSHLFSLSSSSIYTYHLSPPFLSSPVILIFPSHPNYSLCPLLPLPIIVLLLSLSSVLLPLSFHADLFALSPFSCLYLSSLSSFPILIYSPTPPIFFSLPSSPSPVIVATECKIVLQGA